ncbi:hypothetical protein C2G38_2162753 [Gigaspora rosea]|uniref:Uncharacterized protein n=1 Tax=Gigaspora rosea TaxID=44941 RepID=A0A397VVT4_9GLOM|nr:hypothetical protein C2G38_2162753 [Gigaspora rosea]
MSSQGSNNGTSVSNCTGTNSHGNHWVHRGPSLADGHRISVYTPSHANPRTFH